MSPNWPQLVVRLALLGIATVILQVSAVSQIELFGTNADLAPLVIAFVGLLAGSLPGACFGFAVGLFLDLALVQTVGLSSLLYVAVGAVATAVATIGYSLMQFLLGIDAPVSFLLAREILATIVLNAVLALPVCALVRRVLERALPEDPRRRRRRAYTTGGLSPLHRA